MSLEIADNGAMGTCRPRSLAFLVVLAALVFAPHAAAHNAGVAALQVALHNRGLYHGTIDGVQGPGDREAR